VLGGGRGGGGVGGGGRVRAAAEPFLSVLLFAKKEKKKGETTALRRHRGKKKKKEGLYFSFRALEHKKRRGRPPDCSSEMRKEKRNRPFIPLHLISSSTAQKEKKKRGAAFDSVGISLEKKRERRGVGFILLSRTLTLYSKEGEKKGGEGTSSSVPELT